MFLFNTFREQEDETGDREVAQIMYTHVSKCKNDNIKKIKSIEKKKTWAT
jgi:hypothetical protein